MSDLVTQKSDFCNAIRDTEVLLVSKTLNLHHFKILKTVIFINLEGKNCFILFFFNYQAELSKINSLFY